MVVDIPKDVQNTLISYQPGDGRPMEWKTREKWYEEAIENNIVNMERALEAINKSTRPVIYAGGGVNISVPTRELLEFAERSRLLYVSPSREEELSGDSPILLGMVGMHGTRYANYSVSHSDCLIAVGARFSDRVVSRVEKFAPEATIIHIDIDPAEISKNVPTHVPLCGDVKEMLTELMGRVDEKAESEWNRQVREWKEKYPLKYRGKGSLSPQYVIEKLYELTEGKAVITTEVGQNQMWAAQFFKYTEPRTFLTSGGLGAMGFGLGASIGAAMGRPDRRVINIAGDGSFKMNSTELATVSSMGADYSAGAE